MLTIRKLKITLETITPLFLGGADNRTPELRPPPFRGMMRYWFRALAGGVLGDDDGRAMGIIRQKEAEIFGSPDEKHGQSAVWVRLSTPKFTPKDYLLLPHKDKPRFPGIPPGVTPALTLTLKPKAGIQKLEIAAWSLLVGLALGGIGKRSRRGFGSLRIAAIDELPSELDDDLRRQLEQAAKLPASGEELKKRIGGLLTAARNAFEAFLSNPTPGISDLPRFSLLSPNTRIVIWIPSSNLEADYQTVLSPLMNKLSDLMRDEGERNFAQAFGGIRPKRRASPLWAGTHRLQNGGWALVLTHLKAQYLRNQPGNQHHLVTAFLNSPPDGWSKMEVQR